MEYRTLDETKKIALVRSSAVSEPMSREERLERWAAVLGAHGGTLPSLDRIEYLRSAERDRMRVDGSALSLAFNDPILREQGLRSDTYGDAVAFFGLSHSEAHHILCSCHAGETISAQAVAARVRLATRWASDATRPLAVLWLMTGSAIVAGALAALF